MSKIIETARSIVATWNDPTRSVLAHRGNFVAVATTETNGAGASEATAVAIYETDDHTVPGCRYIGRIRVELQRKDTDETTFLQAAAGALRAMQ